MLLISKANPTPAPPVSAPSSPRRATRAHLSPSPRIPSPAQRLCIHRLFHKWFLSTYCVLAAILDTGLYR